MGKYICYMAIALLFLTGCTDQPEKVPETMALVEMRVEDMFPGDEMTQALAEAAADGDVEEIDALVARGADVNARGTRGYTPIVWALENPNKAGFRRLLEHGANPNVRREGSDFSPLHRAVILSSPMVRSLDLDYLRMMFEIGNADPNLEGLETGKLPIEHAMLLGEERTFMLLFNAGADVDRTGSYGNSLIVQATTNFEIMLFLLEKGVNYTHVKKTPHVTVSLQKRIQLKLKSAVLARKPKIAGYPWFWRVVDWLERRGMTFDIPDDVKRPSVLETRPPLANLERDTVRLLQSAFINEVNLTYPTPAWTHTPETAHDVKTEFRQQGSLISYLSFSRDESPTQWTQRHIVTGLYAPGESFESFVQQAKAGLGSHCPNATIQRLPSGSDDRALFHLVCPETKAEAAFFVGRFKDTFVTVRQDWASDAVAYDAQSVLRSMGEIKMEKGFTVTPMPETFEKP